jgi:hypothetical protein
MKTIQIQGKDYVTVNERVKEFHKLYPNGSISTRILSGNEGSVTMEAKVIPNCAEQGRFFTGLAHEVQDAGYINKTSHVENCETSAVGRALGFLGIGIDTSIASADEVDKAIEASPEYQSAKKKALRSIDDWTIDQVKGYELEFGKFKGIRLEQLMGDPKAADWFQWILTQKPKDERGEKVLKIINRFVDEVLTQIQDEETA